MEEARLRHHHHRVALMIVLVLSIHHAHCTTVETIVSSVVSYGARGDGRTDDTKALLDAWNAACSGGGASRRYGSSSYASMVLVPGGRTFVISPVQLRGPCKSLITLQGGGVLDGRGKQWWPKSCKFDSTQLGCYVRVYKQSLVLHDSERVLVDGLTLVNSQQIHFSIFHSSNVTATNLIVSAARKSPNTDGVHVQGSKFVNLGTITIDTGMPASLSFFLSFPFSLCLLCLMLRIISRGRLHLHWSQHISRLHALNYVDIYVASMQGGAGLATGISFRNVQMDNVKNPIIIDQFYCDMESSPQGCVSTRL
ncbi:polygalacturonase ADPG2 [Selaginella moellendorffii]|uniref:polygalacturonase ADPG2 n=1 Tax=Selaginella moellendorffii TaxID=88036 RepID=UPI000D1CF1B0|nr:polygalacturonase ADPG2 [Selaginella moellendorffii]|eukprot:XP_024543460.1 polygalacturonase ADPG2 [Selaginella moellendorffii]